MVENTKWLTKYKVPHFPDCKMFPFFRVSKRRSPGNELPHLFLLVKHAQPHGWHPPVEVVIALNLIIESLQVGCGAGQDSLKRSNDTKVT